MRSKYQKLRRQATAAPHADKIAKTLKVGKRKPTTKKPSALEREENGKTSFSK